MRNIIKIGDKKFNLSFTAIQEAFLEANDFDVKDKMRHYAICAALCVDEITPEEMRKWSLDLEDKEAVKLWKAPYDRITTVGKISEGYSKEQ